MKSERLLSILLLLRTRGLIPAAELAERLEVSVRTIYRDVESLSASGVPVYAERGRHGGIALLPGFRTDVTGLTGDESRALFVLAAQGAHTALGLDEAARSRAAQGDGRPARAAPPRRGTDQPAHPRRPAALAGRATARDRPGGAPGRGLRGPPAAPALPARRNGPGADVHRRPVRTRGQGGRLVPRRGPRGQSRALPRRPRARRPRPPTSPCGGGPAWNWPASGRSCGAGWRSGRRRCGCGRG